MSSALWHFFWTESDWTPAPSVAPAGAGSGGRGEGSKRKKEYVPAAEDFWEIRDRFLRRLMHITDGDTDLPAIVKNYLPPTFNPSYLSRYLAEQQALLRLAQASSNLAQLRNLAPRLTEITRVVTQAKRIQKRRSIRRKTKLYALSIALLLILSLR